VTIVAPMNDLVRAQHHWSTA